ncbi:carbohydrate-binding protein [Massilia orientalis]|uniref:Carbohydrate-binding protein n=1 Tax=Massilia orientalis TaxID=3050128 RepID=A0ACC7MJ66_9BURK|nr:DUF5010 C-terminal domain-containing protein [Massilia sp. YIM B02787]
MSYSVNPSSSGWYTVSYRIATTGATGQVVLSQNGQDMGPTIALPNTGGWQNWTTVSATETLTIFSNVGG